VERTPQLRVSTPQLIRDLRAHECVVSQLQRSKTVVGEREELELHMAVILDGRMGLRMPVFRGLLEHGWPFMRILCFLRFTYKAFHGIM
jgi:hypothetical protein